MISKSFCNRRDFLHTLGGALAIASTGRFGGAVQAQTSPEPAAEPAPFRYRRIFAKKLQNPHEAVIEQLIRDFNLKPDALAQEPWKQVIEQDNWYRQGKVMSWPVFDSAATRTVAPVSSGGVCDGIDDDIEIQQAIDSLPKSGGKVIVLPGTYHLSNCIRPKDDTELEIRGVLRITDAIRSDLARDTAGGQRTITVADAGRFRAGQWITVANVNPRTPLGKDRTGRQRNFGETVPIQSVEGNVITVEQPLGLAWAKHTRAKVDGYYVAQNAFVTTNPSAVLVYQAKRVYIHGPADGRGEIDANRMGQFFPYPLGSFPLEGQRVKGGEELRTSCGISIVDSEWVKVENLYVHDANMHNVALYECRHCEVANVEAARCTDKNVCLFHTQMARIVGNHLHDSVLEDGICCHTPGGPYILIANNRIHDNPRYGIHLGNSSPNAIIVRNHTRSNGADMDLKDGNPTLVLIENETT